MERDSPLPSPFGTPMSIRVTLAENPSDLEDPHVDEKSSLLGQHKSGAAAAAVEDAEPSLWERLRYEGCSVAIVREACTLQRLKVGVLLAVMIFAAVVFTATPETEELCELRMIGISSDFPYAEAIEGAHDHNVHIVQVYLAADALPGEGEARVTVALQGSADGGTTWTDVDDRWEVFLGDADMELEDTTTQFAVTQDERDLYDVFRLLYETDWPAPLPLNTRVLEMGGLVRAEVEIAAVILVGVYVLIVFELVHRTVAALTGSFVALAALSAIRYRPSLEEVISWIDMETIGLLFGMMVMVGIFSTTGFFEYSAIQAYKLSKGDLWLLTTYLCVLVAVLTAFLDSVTTVLLLCPVTIRLCRVLDVDPFPMLMAIVAFCNIGGTATAVGDPPNVIILNDRRIQSTGEITFGSFIVHVAPGVVLCLFVCYWLIRWQTKPLLVRQPHQGLKQEIAVWEATVRRVNPLASEEDGKVHEMLTQHIATLRAELSRAQDEPVQPIDISELESKYVIRNWPLFVSSSIVLGVVIIMFFLHSALHVDLSLAWIAIIGAMVHLVVADVHDVDEVMEKIEWSTLLFFAGLFVLMRALEELGLIQVIANAVEDVVKQVDGDQNRLAVAVVLIIWVSALFSAFIDNIPFTSTMLPVVWELHCGPLQLPLGPLIWALSYGVCIGGQGTCIGASANVVMIGIAEAERIHISFTRFFKFGFPVMILAIFVATVYLLITHVLIPWYPDDVESVGYC